MHDQISNALPLDAARTTNNINMAGERKLPDPNKLFTKINKQCLECGCENCMRKMCGECGPCKEKLLPVKERKGKKRCVMRRCLGRSSPKEASFTPRQRPPKRKIEDLTEDDDGDDAAGVAAAANAAIDTISKLQKQLKAKTIECAASSLKVTELQKALDEAKAREAKHEQELKNTQKELARISDLQICTQYKLNRTSREIAHQENYYKEKEADMKKTAKEDLDKLRAELRNAREEGYQDGLNVWNNNNNNDDYKGYDYLPLTSPPAASAEHN
jgi:hypothetical protein